MTLPRLLTLPLALLAVGCLPDSKSLDGDGGGGGQAETGPANTTSDAEFSASGAMPPSATSGGTVSPSDDGTGNETSVPTTATSGDSASTTGEPCRETLCEACDEECVASYVCIDGVYVCGCDCEGVPSCDLGEVACALADLGGAAPIHCGIVTLADDLAAWEAMHSCVLSQVAKGQGFKGVLELQGIDSAPGLAYVGQAGVQYVTMALYQNLNGFGGGGGAVDETITGTDCGTLLLWPNCAVAVGESCLQCVDPGPKSVDPVCAP